MEMSDLQKLIGNQDFEQAKAFVQGQKGKSSLYQAECLVIEVLRGDKSKLPQDLLDLVLSVFLGAYNCGDHGEWVHCLSHFTSKLWKSGQFEWIQKFNQVAFKGAKELGVTNCCDRLVDDFSELASWDKDPAAFHLTMENLAWMDWEYHEQAKARINHGLFESKEALEICRLRGLIEQKAELESLNFELGLYLLDLDKLKKIVRQLQELGDQSLAYEEVKKAALKWQLNKLESKLNEADEEDREKFRKAIAFVKQEL